MAKKNQYNETEVRELQLYLENDSEIYNKRLLPIYKNLEKKQVKGVYDSKKATKLYGYAVNDGAKKYTKEFGSSNNIFSSADKKEVAKRMEKENRDDLKNLI